MPENFGVVRSRMNQLIASRELELGRRIKQIEIAEETGLNPNTISRWMNPKPFERLEVEPLVKLCAWLECEIGDLLYIDHG